MSKLLLILVVVIVGVLMWRAAATRGRKQERPPEPPPVQTMVRCAECEVHLPESDAVALEGRHFCTEAHRADFIRRRTGQS